ncbi:MAG: OmpA family protein [Elusimicrobiota bacterium]
MSLLQTTANFYSYCRRLTMVGVVTIVMLIPSFVFGRKDGKLSDWKWYPLPDKKAGSQITSLAVDNNLVWVGTKEKLWSWQKDKQKWKSYEQIKGGVNTLLVDEKVVWCATAKEIFYLRKDTNKWGKLTIPQNIELKQINALVWNEPNLWIGCDNGLVEGAGVFTDKAGFLLYNSNDGLSGNKVKCLFRIGGDLYIAATGSSIDIYNLKSRKWQRLTPPTSLYGYVGMTGIGKYIWLATNGGGIREYDLFKKEWKSFTAENGLGDDFVQTIESDGQYLWVGTFSGMNSLNISNSSWRVFNSEVTAGGLEEDSVTALAVDGNYLWIGTDGGLGRFDKKVPQVKLNIGIKEYVLGDKEAGSEISFQGSVSSEYKIKTLAASYNSSVFPSLWLEKGMQIAGDQRKKKEAVLISWDLNSLIDQEDIYYVKLKAVDKNNRSNEALDYIKIKIAGPKLVLDEPKKKLFVGSWALSGRFNLANVDKIVVNPDAVLATLDIANLSFHCQMNLKEGKNKFEVVFYDGLGRSVKKELTVTAEAKREIVEAKIPPPAAERKELMTAEEVKVQKEQLLIRIYFDQGKNKVKTRWQPVLKKVVEMLSRKKDLAVRIEGYSDNLPVSGLFYSTNKELSEARALNIFFYMADKGKLDARRFFLVGYGEKKAIGDNSTESGRAKNRRVDIYIYYAEKTK